MTAELDAAPEPRVRKGWLRRNALALIVLLVAIPGLVIVVLWLPTLDNESRQQVTTVAQGDSIEKGGYRFTLTRSQEFVGTGSGPGGNSIPIGTSLVGTIMEVTPLPGAKAKDGSCTMTLTERSGSRELSWSQVSNVEQFDYALGDERTAYCLLEGKPIQVETVFLTPTGAYKHATVDVTGIGSALSPMVYRFALVH